MSESVLPSHPLKVAELPENRATEFELVPNADERAAIAADLDLLGLRKLRFTGALSPDGDQDWQMQAKLGATVVQPCIVTLEPVTTRIDTSVSRRFLAKMPEIDPEQEETEMFDDESIDPLGSEIDPATVMIEALALNLPLYPRSEGAELGEAVFTEPGQEALRDEDLRPFAGLAALREKLSGGDPDKGSSNSS